MAQQGDFDVTGLLTRWQDGDKGALDILVPLVYRELRRVASARLRNERGGRSLQTTALVHETYVRLLDLNRLGLQNRAHFFAVAARLMRRIVVDFARRERTQKRGAGAAMVGIDVEMVAAGETPDMLEIVAVDQALDELAAMDERLSRVVELKFFAGLTIDECADALDLSPATVERDWAVAKTWLFDRLADR